MKKVPQVLIFLACLMFVESVLASDDDDNSHTQHFAQKENPNSNIIILNSNELWKESNAGREDFIFEAICQGSLLDTLDYINFTEADMQLTDEEGNTPLALAIVEGQIEIVQYFIKQEANVNTADNCGAP